MLKPVKCPKLYLSYLPIKFYDKINKADHCVQNRELIRMSLVTHYIVAFRLRPTKETETTTKTEITITEIE